MLLHYFRDPDCKPWWVNRNNPCLRQREHNQKNSQPQQMFRVHPSFDQQHRGDQSFSLSSVHGLHRKFIATAIWTNDDFLSTFAVSLLVLQTVFGPKIDNLQHASHFEAGKPETSSKSKLQNSILWTPQPKVHWFHDYFSSKNFHEIFCCWHQRKIFHSEQCQSQGQRKESEADYFLQISIFVIILHLTLCFVSLVRPIVNKSTC